MKLWRNAGLELGLLVAVCEEGVDPVGRHRTTGQITLHFVAAFGAQPVELVYGLDTCGRRRDVEGAAKAGKIFVPEESYKAWTERARAVANVQARPMRRKVQSSS